MACRLTFRLQVPPLNRLAEPSQPQLQQDFTFKNTATTTQIQDAREIVAWYTLAASATGAIPVPAASAAIVAESGCMIAHVASVLGTPITVGSVLGTVQLMGK